jgi:hypothetical protein
MSKFTSGPWEFTEPFELPGLEISVDIQISGKGRKRADKNGGMIIARCCGPDMEENARLISAAPDLLEALTRSRAQWIHSVNKEICLAAISKAEGK